MGISQLHLTFPLLVSPLFDYICFDCVVLFFLFFHFLQLAVQLLAMRRVRVWSVDEAKLVKNKMFHKLRRISENVVIHQALRVFIVFVLFHTHSVYALFSDTRALVIDANVRQKRITKKINKVAKQRRINTLLIYSLGFDYYSKSAGSMVRFI